MTPTTIITVHDTIMKKYADRLSAIIQNESICVADLSVDTHLSESRINQITYGLDRPYLAEAFALGTSLVERSSSNTVTLGYAVGLDLLN